MLSAANTRRTRNPGRGGKWREERAGDGRGGEELEGGRGTEEQQQSLNATQRNATTVLHGPHPFPLPLLSCHHHPTIMTHPR